MTHLRQLTHWFSPRTISRRLLLTGIWLLTFAALVDPADDIFHLKSPAFALVMLVWLFRKGILRPTLPLRIWIAVCGFGIVLPLFWTVVGFLRFNVHSPEMYFGTLKSFLFVLLLLVLLTEEIDLASLVVRMSILVALLTFVMVGVNLFFPAAFDALYAFSMAKNNAIITTSRHLLGGGVGMFYYKTSALLVFPFAYHFYRATSQDARKLVPLLWSAFYAAALFFSGARANFLGAVFIAGVFATAYLGRKIGWGPALALASCIAVLFTSTVVLNLLNPTETSNSIKLLHVQSYEQQFNSHPSILLWGQGADTAFFSNGYEGWTTVTELSYLEMVRVFGIPVTLLFLSGLFWICRKNFRNRQSALGLAFLAYLFVCATNPLLISSTGFLAICAVWKEAEQPSTALSAFHLPESVLNHTPKRGFSHTPPLRTTT